MSHLRPLRPLCCGLLRLNIRVQLIKEGVGLRLHLSDEPTVGLHLGLILDGIQDGLLLRHLLQLGDGELRLHLHHAHAGSLLLHGLRLLLLLLLLLLLVILLLLRRL
ncbi:Cytochrome P450 87A3 [Hordeum vulgare]|nr:Cytochrome P450 87A3 [Hordeum vulgare]